MRIRLLAVGTRMPRWVEEGYREYARRLGRGWSLELIEIPLAKRTRNANLCRLRDQEGQSLLAAVPTGSRVVVLEEAGKAWSTRELAARMQDWQLDGGGLALLIGGPDGLSAACRTRADLAWSLSPLTLPHGLVRVVVAEQIYRAWSVIANHPYHRD